jgi:hypothetical protein
MRRAAAASLITILAIAACRPASQVTSVQAPASLAVERMAKVVVSNGTSRLMGSIRMPAPLLHHPGLPSQLDLVPDATISVLTGQTQLGPDAKAIAVSGGQFIVKEVPVGGPLLLQATVQASGYSFVLKKLLHPSEALTCAHMDLATTLVADQIMSASPLLTPDDGLSGADLIQLFDIARLEQLEAKVRARIPDKYATLIGLPAALTAGATAPYLAKIIGDDPTLVSQYQAVFDRPDSSVNIRIASVGTSSVRTGDRAPVFGVLHFKVTGADPDAQRIEYWLLQQSQQKIGESTVGPSFDYTFDTWGTANGDYSLDTVEVTPKRRKLLGVTPISIQNGVPSFCPLP